MLKLPSLGESRNKKQKKRGQVPVTWEKGRHVNLRNFHQKYMGSPEKWDEVVATRSSAPVAKWASRSHLTAAWISPSPNGTFGSSEKYLLSATAL